LSKWKKSKRATQGKKKKKNRMTELISRCQKCLFWGTEWKTEKATSHGAARRLMKTRGGEHAQGTSILPGKSMVLTQKAEENNPTKKPRRKCARVRTLEGRNLNSKLGK